MSQRLPLPGAAGTTSVCVSELVSRVRGVTLSCVVVDAVVVDFTGVPAPQARTANQMLCLHIAREDNPA